MIILTNEQLDAFEQRAKYPGGLTGITDQHVRLNTMELLQLVAMAKKTLRAEELLQSAREVSDMRGQELRELRAKYEQLVVEINLIKAGENE